MDKHAKQPVTHAPSPPPVTPVDVYLTGGAGTSRGAGYIWTAEDAFRVRNEFRLLGDFVGTLPKHCAQNQYLALPLVLCYEELAFGVACGFFRLLSDSPASDYVAKNPEHAAAASVAFYVARDADFTRQATIACDQQDAERAKQMSKNAANAAKRPRSSGNPGRLSPSCAVASTTAAAPTTNGSDKRAQSNKRCRSNSFADADADADQAGLADTPRRRKMRKTGGGGMFARISTSFLAALHRVMPALVADPHAPTPEDVAADKAAAELANAASAERIAALRERSFAQARASAVTITPTEARPGERCRATLAVEIPVPNGMSRQRLALRGAVFRDLYHKGYYMSCGAKFGADFLAYAGEPLLYHAALAVIVMHADDPVSAHDVVALGRLGDSTKKRTVLAYVNGDIFDSNNVGYIGIQWEESLP
jgi:tRNA splicing endonuclease